ncbi:unnamed protein product [Didymodactylos carnosus]|uniref:Uncharacterized protein n=1 Tax=Didymodactylos carnosus TaxID=1234261 RepID=A0A816GIV2_9BILA|nr:unnamed protein product [Didymodactylos carnosus]CAF4657471.1 unnamed protein product [Didymodactylos carnosus]
MEFHGTPAGLLPGVSIRGSYCYMEAWIFNRGEFLLFLPLLLRMFLRNNDGNIECVDDVSDSLILDVVAAVDSLEYLTVVDDLGKNIYCYVLNTEKEL